MEVVGVMKFGIWIEFCFVDGLVECVKLLWISLMSGCYLFVNWCGFKVGDYVLQELVVLFVGGSVWVLVFNVFFDCVMDVIVGWFSQFVVSDVLECG